MAWDLEDLLPAGIIQLRLDGTGLGQLCCHWEKVLCVHMLLHECNPIKGIKGAVAAVPLLPAVPALRVVCEVPALLDRGALGPGNELLDLYTIGPVLSLKTRTLCLIRSGSMIVCALSN